MLLKDDRTKAANAITGNGEWLRHWGNYHFKPEVAFVEIRFLELV